VPAWLMDLMGCSSSSWEVDHGTRVESEESEHADDDDGDEDEEEPEEIVMISMGPRM
jgi:hypothetical protein